jgi:hypothetical protein
MGLGHQPTMKPSPRRPKTSATGVSQHSALPAPSPAPARPGRRRSSGCPPASCRWERHGSHGRGGGKQRKKHVENVGKHRKHVENDGKINITINITINIKLHCITTTTISATILHYHYPYHYNYTTL